MVWTYWDWVLCNTLVGVGIVLFSYIIIGIILWKGDTLFYNMIAKLFSIKRCIIDVNHEVVRKNNAIYTSQISATKGEYFISKLCSCYKNITDKNPSLTEEVTTTPISNLFSTLCSRRTATVSTVENVLTNTAENSSTASNQHQPNENESNQGEADVDNSEQQNGIFSCCFPKKDDVNDQKLHAETEIPPTHPSHPEHEREVLNVYGRFLTLSKKINKFLIMTITVIVISSIIIAGFQGCFLANITVYQDGPCPFYGVMDCFYGPNYTYFQCTPNSTINFQIYTASATCFRWIGRDTSVSDVMTQIGACTGLLAAFGAFVEFLIRLLLFVFQQRPSVAAGIRRMLEKTVGVNRVTQPYRCYKFTIPCHFGVLNLHLYRRPWLVVIFFLIYCCLPVIAVASIILLSYFRISITALTYIILITLVLISCLSLLWVLWEEDEIGRILPGAWSDLKDLLDPFREGVLPVFESVVSKKDLDNQTNNVIQKLVQHFDGTLPNEEMEKSTHFQRETPSRIQVMKKLTGSAQEIRLRKELETEKDIGKTIIRRS